MQNDIELGKIDVQAQLLPNTASSTTQIDTTSNNQVFLLQHLTAGFMWSSIAMALFWFFFIKSRSPREQINLRSVRFLDIKFTGMRLRVGVLHPVRVRHSLRIQNNF